MKGKGKIVKKEWVERCHSERKRLPWRRFCLDNVRMIYFGYVNVVVEILERHCLQPT